MKTNMSEPIKNTILIIDDCKQNLLLYRTMLTWKGYDVQLAQNGRGGLKAAREKRPDLILLDVMMPEMDGFAVCQALKTDRETHSIPVIFVTARDEIEVRDKCREVGGIDYLVKPILLHELVDRITRHLEPWPEAS